MKLSFKIYSDGAATMEFKNRRYIRVAGGWAYVILDENDNEIAGGFSGELETTNNAMELTAIKEGLKRFLAFDYAGKGIELYSDSAYCVNIFTNWIKSWKANGWTRGKKHEPIENVEIIKEIDRLIDELNRRFCEVKFVKVKAHNGNYWNEKVDKMAVEGKLNVRRNIEVETDPVSMVAWSSNDTLAVFEVDD